MLEGPVYQNVPKTEEVDEPVNKHFYEKIDAEDLGTFALWRKQFVDALAVPCFLYSGIL